MDKNPFPLQDKDRYDIWNMLVERDIKAFARQDWDMVADDFIEGSFIGIDAGGKPDPDDWKLSFPDLNSYKKIWLAQARSFSETKWGEDAEAALFRVTELKNIEIQGDTALVHKKFAGEIKKANGETMPTNWQTLYHCKKVNDNWKITGFNGYMPNSATDNKLPLKQVPAGAKQHSTAGPYSSVLIVNPGQLVVISGQAAIDMDGKVIGDTIEEQAAYTLDNCAKQLAFAGCTLNDVFKVNVYLTDLENWPRFNEVYKKYFAEPRPVRAAVQTGLLMTLLVEIEMWAVKS